MTFGVYIEKKSKNQTCQPTVVSILKSIQNSTRWVLQKKIQLIKHQAKAYEQLNKRKTW